MTLSRRIVGFVRFLREMGFKASQSHLLNATEAVLAAGLQKECFKEALKCTICTNEWEWSSFDSLFEVYFSQHKKSYDKEEKTKPKAEDKTKPKETSKELVSTKKDTPSVNEDIDTSLLELASNLGYSPFSAFVKKEIQNFSNYEIQKAQVAIRYLIQPFRLNKMRRTIHGKGTRLNMRSTLRDAIRHFGWPLKLMYSQKKKRLKRLVIISDVSGSMQRFNSLVIPFLLGLKGVGSKAEVFVFSTRPKKVTELLRHISLNKALERVVKETPEWSGGTRIGESLSTIRREYGRRLFNNKSVVLIISDGWDLGAKPMLLKEMRGLYQKVHKVIWLNPIGGDPNLAIMSQAVKMCLPYIHFHIPAASLRELSKAALLIGKVIANGSKGLRL